MFLTLDHIQRLTPDIWTFYFQPQSAFRFEAGQYIEICIPHADPDNRGERRWMTISSAPQEPLTAITMRFTPINGSTYKAAARQLQPGAVLYASDPIGDFVLPKDPRLPLVFITAGIGITPAYSMLQHLQHTGQQRNVHLLYAARSPRDLVFHPFLTQLPITYTPMISQPAADWQGLVGKLQADHIWSIVDKPHAKLFYFSGPEDLIMQLVGNLHQLGLQRSQVVLDYFPGYHNDA